jgi:hypothetical protein
LAVKKLQNVEELLNSLKTEDELRRFLEQSSLVTDPLSLELMKRIGGSHSPMAVTDLPIPNFPRDVALARLYLLEKLGYLKSRFERRGAEDFVRVFDPTPLVRRIAEIITE